MIPKIQLLLLALILGFLTGPRVVDAVKRITENARGSSNSAQVVESITPPTVAKAEGETAKNDDPFSALALHAKSAYVWDIQAHKKIFGYNEHTTLPLASLTKVMVALVATEILPDDTTITITAGDLLSEGDSGLLAGEKWKLSDLLDLTLMSSSNDGASAIAGVAGSSLSLGREPVDREGAKQLFIERMNKKARVIGLETTYFSNESGLDIESMVSGAYGSARDIAMLFEYVYRRHPSLFSGTALPGKAISSESNLIHHVVNTNQAVEHLTGVIGSKTGYTDLAGGNIAMIVDVGIDHPVAIVVLGSTRDGRFTDAEKLIAATASTIIDHP